MLDIFKPEFEALVADCVKSLEKLANDGLTQEQRQAIIEEAHEDVEQINVFVQSVM